MSNPTLYDLVQKGQIPARKRGGRWQVDQAALEQVLAKRTIPAGWLTTAEAGARLGVSAQEVLRRIGVAQLQSRKHGRLLLVAADEVEQLIVPDGWLRSRRQQRARV